MRGSTNTVNRPLSKGEMRMKLRAQRGKEITRGAVYSPKIQNQMRDERIAQHKNDILECGKELNSDKKAIDFSMSLLDAVNNGVEGYNPREKMSTIFGISPPAPYGCFSEECQEQNRKHRRSEIDFQNSRIGKEVQCLTDCIKNKRQNQQYENILPLTPSSRIAMVKQELDTINYAYNSKCGSIKANKSEAENKTKNLYLILGAIVVLLILKK